MDTRSKIVDGAAAAAAARACRERGGKVAALAGYFDVLQTGDVGEAAELKKGCDLLIALVAPPAQPVLAERARAEMAAALRVIDYVVITENGPALEALLADVAPDTVVRREDAGEQRLRQLIEHVHRRHTGG